MSQNLSSAAVLIGALRVNSLNYGYICFFACFYCRLLIFFQNQLFQKILSGIPSVSNSWDPDQDRYFVGPDLCTNCLQS